MSIMDSDLCLEYYSQDWTYQDGIPTGGSTFGVGIAINWQKGPLGKKENRLEANGAFVETLINIAKSRLEFYQNSKLKNDENQKAIEHLEKAIQALNDRAENRKMRNVEGTYEE